MQWESGVEEDRFERFSGIAIGIGMLLGSWENTAPLVRPNATRVLPSACECFMHALYVCGACTTQPYVVRSQHDSEELVEGDLLHHGTHNPARFLEKPEAIPGRIQGAQLQGDSVVLPRPDGVHGAQGWNMHKSLARGTH